MRKQTPHWLTPQVLIIGGLCIVSSFSLGVKSTGEVQTVGQTRAEQTQLTGDINGDGRIDNLDVIAILEIVHGYKTATPAELKADPNGDGKLTIDDAISLLYDIQSHTL